MNAVSFEGRKPFLRLLETSLPLPTGTRGNRATPPETRLLTGNLAEEAAENCPFFSTLLTALSLLAARELRTARVGLNNASLARDTGSRP